MTTVVLTAPDEGPPVVGPPVDTGVWQRTRHLLIMPDGVQWEVSSPRTGVFLTRDGITGLDDPQWDLFTSDSPVLHGTRFHGYRAPEREVVLPIYLYHDDGSEAWTERYRAFKRWMSPRHIVRWRVEHPESGEGRTLHMRYVDSGNPTATLDHRQRGWKHMSLHFVADERPFWEGDPISRSWRQAEPVDFFDEEGSPPFHVSSSALLGDAVVTNPGGEDAWPVWTVDDGDFTSVTVGVDGRIVEAPIEVQQPQPVDVAVNGDGSDTSGVAVVGENLATNPRGRNNERQALVSNLVTNPRGRGRPDAGGPDPDSARTALLDALAAYTDAPVQWSATEPGDTSVVWVDPGTGVARVWSDGVGGSVDDVVTRRNLVTNPSFETGTHDVDPQAAMSVSLTEDPAGVVSGERGLEIQVSRGTGFSQQDVHLNVSVSPDDAGRWIAFSLPARRASGDTEFVRLGVGGAFDTGFRLNENLLTEQTRRTLVRQIPDGEDSMTLYIRASGEFTGGLPLEGILHTDALMAAIADTEAQALAAVSTYFDGDTPTRRTDNIIYRYAWEGTTHASPSTETALGRGWHTITDEGVVATGGVWADAVVAHAPHGWNGPVFYSPEYDAVHIPTGAQVTVPTETLDQTSTLAVYEVTTEDVAYHAVTDPVTLPAADHDRYVRALVTPGAYDGPYVDGDSTPEPETVVEWDDAPHTSASRITALVPDGWGQGVRYGEVEDAVYIPAGVVARPATEPADGGTLVVRDLTAGTITRQPITGQARLPASDRGRYVRVMATTAPLFRGPYLDAHTWDEDPDLALEWAGEPGESGFQLTAPCPEGWDGEGVYYSATREAVFVPAGVEVAVQADGVGELVIDSSQGSYRAPFEGVIPSATTDRYLSFAVMQPTGEPVSLVLDARPGPRGKSAYVHSGDEAARRTGDLTRREWAPIPPGESVPVSLSMVGDGRVTVTITPLFSEAY